MLTTTDERIGANNSADMTHLMPIDQRRGMQTDRQTNSSGDCNLLKLARLQDADHTDAMQHIDHSWTY